MDYLKPVSSMDIISSKLAQVINRTDVALSEYVVKLIIDMYFEMLGHGDFCIESLLEASQSHDETLLYEIAEETIRTNNELKFYEKCKEQYGDDTYDELIDDIVNEYIMEYGIMLFLAYPPYSKQTIPYEFSGILDKVGGSYYVNYPPAGSFEEYIGHLKLKVWYNDAQNSLCSECAVHDQYDDSLVFVERKCEEIVYIE